MVAYEMFYIIGATNIDILPSYVADFTIERELEKLLDKLTFKVSRSIDTLSGFIGFDPHVEIYLKFNGTGIFRGRVKTSNKKVYYEVEAFSCGEILSRTIVQKVYTNTTPEDIFEDLITTYTDLTPIITVSGTTMDRFIADGYISDISEKLIIALGWLMYTDSSKNIYFQPRGTTTNATVIRRQPANSNAIFGEWKRDHNELCNHIQITGDNINYNTQQTFTGDSSSIIYTLSEMPNTIKIAVGGVEQTTDDYTVAKETKIITFTSAPVSNSTTNITMDYIYAYPIYASRQDNNSVNTYGRFSKSETHKWIKTRPDATSYANNYVSKYKNPLLFNDVTMNAGYITSFNPGEKVRIIDDLESIDGYYVINKIKLQYLKGIVELTVGDYLETFIGIQQVLQIRIKDLEKEDVRFVLAINVNETETLVPTETFAYDNVHYLNFKLEASNHAKCDATRDSVNDARCNLCQTS